jgi:hypothetical protein
VCYEPVAAVDAENLKKKQEAFQERYQTTHWSSQVRFKDEKIYRKYARFALEL